jgi:hypothetical protein
MQRLQVLHEWRHYSASFGGFSHPAATGPIKSSAAATWNRYDKTGYGAVEPEGKSMVNFSLVFGRVGMLGT